jgi:hypothetical protein
MSPLLKIRGCEESDDVFLSVRYDHDPAVFIADDFGVSEMGRWRMKGNDWISRIVVESIAYIKGVSNLLCL